MDYFCNVGISNIWFYTTTKDTISLSQLLEEVQVKGVNAGEKTPVSYTNLTEEEIEKSNLGQDLPYLISLTPSVVSSSDLGQVLDTLI